MEIVAENPDPGLLASPSIQHHKSKGYFQRGQTNLTGSWALCLQGKFGEGGHHCE